MFCMHCGANNAPDDRFCARCGANLHEDADAAAATAPAPATTPSPAATATEPAPAAQPSEPAAPAEAQQHAPEPAATPDITPVAPIVPDATAAAATVARPRRGWVKPVVITLVVALIAGGCGLGAFLTWRAGIWGGKIMPNPSDFTPAAGQSLTADIVAKQLNDKGIATQIKQVYAAQPKGQYAGIEGAQPGDRIQNGQTVTVKSSLGPGVPQGTVGKTADEAKDALKDMGVPVTVKKLVVADDSTVPEGSVVATSPADGQALPDDQKTDGIFVGVASKGDGIPYDILGKDIDAVKSQLEAKGYTVDVQDRLARKDYIGKVSGSDPAPGSDASGSKTVTLYRGIDGKDAKKALTSVKENGKVFDGIWSSPFTLAGRYCTKSGKCLTFVTDSPTSSPSSPSLLYQTEGSTSVHKEDTNNGQFPGPPMSSCGAFQDIYCGTTDTGYLISGDTGAFELFPRDAIISYMCGATVAYSDTWTEACVNGQLQSFDPTAANLAPPAPTGASFEMDDLYLVVPVGADLDKLKSSGYFDDAALKDADGKPAVDTTRPFIVARDKSLYDSTSAPFNGDNSNPFLPDPGWYGQSTEPVKMKPAPTDGNVYYLVDNADMDWKSLPNADLSGSAPSSSPSPSASPSSTKPDFSPVAGEYGFQTSSDGAWWTSLTVNADGTFTGEYREVEYKEGVSMADSPRIPYPFHGAFTSISKNDANGYDLQCDTASFAFDKTPNSGSDTGMVPCTTWHWYPANTPFSSMKGGTVEEIQGGLTYAMDKTSLDVPLMRNEGDTLATFKQDPK